MEQKSGARGLHFISWISQISGGFLINGRRAASDDASFLKKPALALVTGTHKSSLAALDPRGRSKSDQS